MTSTGRCSRSAIQATVAVLPVPVAPSSTVSFSSARTRRVISAIAVGWSPAGTMSVMTVNGATLRCKSVTGRTSPPSPSFPTLGGGTDIPGLQLLPELTDPAVQVVKGARIVDYDVGDGQALLAGGPGCHPRPARVRGHAALGDEPLGLELWRHVHHDDQVEAVLAAALGQQG